jgi:hypothetical protein
MITRFECRVFVAAALALFPLLGRAQPPSGEVNFFFDSPSTAVFDLTGTYTLGQEITGTGGATTPLTLEGLVIDQDNRGRLHGAGVIVVGIGEDFVAANYKATGRISGGGSSITRVTLVVRLKGEDIVRGVDTKFNISIKYTLEVDATGLTGSARGSAKLSRLGGGKIDSFIEGVPLPPDVNGSWTSQLNVVALNRLAGSGSIILSNGRAVQGKLSGRYSASSALSRMKLLGSGDSRGNKLDLTLFDLAAEPEHLSGKILGQGVLE